MNNPINLKTNKKISEYHEIPNEKLLSSIEEAEKDYKKGVLNSFDDVDLAIEHLKKLNTNY